MAGYVNVYINVCIYSRSAPCGSYLGGTYEKVCKNCVGNSQCCWPYGIWRHGGKNSHEGCVFLPSSQPLIGSAGVDLTKTVTAITGGDIEMRFFEPGALVPAFEVLDAVGAGTADAAWSNPGYHTSKDIAFAMFSAIPFGPGAGEYAAWMFYGGGQDFMNEKLYNKWRSLRNLRCFSAGNIWLVP